MSADVRRIAWILCTATALVGMLALVAAHRDASQPDRVPAASVDAPESAPSEAVPDTSTPSPVGPETDDTEDASDALADDAADDDTAPEVDEPVREIGLPPLPPHPRTMAKWAAKRDALPSPDDGWCLAQLGIDELPDVPASVPVAAVLPWDTRVQFTPHGGIAVADSLDGDTVRMETGDVGSGRGRLETRLVLDRRVDEVAAEMGSTVHRRDVRVGDRIGVELCSSERRIVGRRIMMNPDGTRGGCHPMRHTMVQRAVAVSSGDYLLVASYEVREYRAASLAALDATLDSLVLESLSAPTIE